MKRRNRKKIGRNDPCPCGSGKKYKNCCLGKSLPSSPHPSSSGIDKLKAEFVNYNQSELIAMLGGLQVYPENHSHTIRLEAACRVASSIKSIGKRKVNQNHLQNILNKYFPTNGHIGMMEDPPENLFTENIVFHGGNYIVYPGVTDGGSFVLRNLFLAIFHHGEGFPKKFIEIVKTASLSLLTLNNEVAKRMGHSRYMDSPDTLGKEVEVPDANQISSLCNSVI